MIIKAILTLSRAIYCFEKINKYLSLRLLLLL